MTNPTGNEPDDMGANTHSPTPNIEDEAATKNVECASDSDGQITARIRTEEHWEVVRAQLLPMFIRRATLLEIAEAFRVSVNTAGAWRARLIEDLRKEAGNMQPRDYIMESVSSLRLARAEAWRAVMESENPKDHRAALHLVTAVENQSTKLGTMIGLYGRVGDRPLQAVEGDQVDDEVRQLRSILLELLSRDDHDVEINGK